MSTVVVCATAFVDVIKYGRRNVYVSKALAVISGMRQVFIGRAWEYILGTASTPLCSQTRVEIKALGSSFGRHSAGHSYHLKD